MKGYEYIKGAVEANGYERCAEDLLFAVKRDCRSENGWLGGIAEVCQNNEENYERMKAYYPLDEYVLWSGTYEDNEVKFYWS